MIVNHIYTENKWKTTDSFLFDISFSQYFLLSPNVFKKIHSTAPPPDHGNHRYIFCVTALPVDHLPIDAETTSPAVCHFQMFGAGVVGRAFLTATFGH